MAASALIVAAGRGLRAGGGLLKQYRPLAGPNALTRTLRAFEAHPEIDTVVVVIHPDDRAPYEQAIAPLDAAKLAVPVAGGPTRQASVRAGLEALRARAPEIVLVHDAVRPFLSAELIARAIAAARRHGAAIPALPVTDTIAETDASGLLIRNVVRDNLRAVQTPQAFRFDLLLAAHEAAAASGRSDFTDDGSVVRAAGHGVQLFDGEPGNLKLTTEKDFREAERHLLAEQPLITRVATGYDVHAFGPGDHIWLGGVKIPHGSGLVGHSDADVILHAMTDAVLGTITDGDIGVHFPPSDPGLKGAASHRFLGFAVGRLRAQSGMLDHLDAIVVCEAPRIGPYRDAMRIRIAEIAGLMPGAVSIKATTSERLGFTGRREGIAAWATATARVPLSLD